MTCVSLLNPLALLDSSQFSCRESSALKQAHLNLDRFSKLLPQETMAAAVSELCSLGLLVWDSATSSSPCDQGSNPVPDEPDAAPLFFGFNGKHTCLGSTCSGGSMTSNATCQRSTHAIVTGTGHDGTEALLLATVLPSASDAGVTHWLLHPSILVT